MSSAFAKEIFEGVSKEFLEIETEIQNVDAVAMWMVTRPQRFGIVVAENMFGDILSDVAGGVMGGLGLAASANVGDTGAYFEPVHGSAPHMSGQGRANPSAMIISASLMLDHLGFEEEAKELLSAVRSVVRKAPCVTYDLGGSEDGTTMARMVKELRRMGNVKPHASIVTVGDELLAGHCHNTNLKDISMLLDRKGFVVRERVVLGDRLHDIVNQLRGLVGVREMIVLTGGLGSVNDNLTRQAVASAIERPLEERPELVAHIEASLAGVNLSNHQIDRSQAKIPKGAEVLFNANGTACGFKVQVSGTDIVVLPGPQREAMTVFGRVLVQRPDRIASTRWMLFDQFEKDIAPVVDELATPYGLKGRYVWRFPYLEVSVSNGFTDEVPTELEVALDRLFEPTCVSRNGMSAMQVFDPDTPCRIEGGDEALLRALDNLGQKTGNAYVPCFEVSVSPPLPDILVAPEQGSFRFLCSVNDETLSDMKIELRAQDVVQQIRELFCWAVMRYTANPFPEVK